MLTSHWSVTPLLWSALEEPFGGTSIISISITISLERNESGSRLTNGEETETGYFLTICITYRTWQRPSGCSSVTRRGLWTLIFPSMSLFRRTSFLLKSEISWEEKKKKKMIRVQMRPDIVWSVSQAQKCELILKENDTETALISVALAQLATTAETRISGRF